MSAKGKVLLTGASGLLGRQIHASLKANGWDVLGLAYSRCGDGLVKVDLCNFDEMKQLFVDHKPHVVVHSAAERRPDKVENDTENAKKLNVTATSELTKLCQQHNSYLIYISTDYVFDGTSPPYRHDDKPNPLNTYGQLKLEGEQAVSLYKNSFIVRVPILYGPIESLNESAVTILFKALLSPSDPAPMSDYEKRYPTHTRDVGRFIEALASDVVSNPDLRRGVWHFGGTECYTKYGMALIMAEIFNMSSDHLIAVKEPSSGAPRPFNNQFEMSETERQFVITMTPLREGLKDVLKTYIPSGRSGSY